MIEKTYYMRTTFKSLVSFEMRVVDICKMKAVVILEMKAAVTLEMRVVTILNFEQRSSVVTGLSALGCFVWSCLC